MPVSRFNWVVNEPVQLLRTPSSRTVPYAVKLTPVLPPPRFVSRNGESNGPLLAILKATHVCDALRLAQLVLAAGNVRKPVKLKSRDVPGNVMKSSTTAPPPAIRSMMSPVTPAPNVPPEYVMLVPAPVVMQPVPAAVPTGNHVIVVEETVTPPPPQFA